MDTKKLKINIPEGYEIDKEKSTFEEIIFKKVDPLSKLPKTWEEYCKHTKGCPSFYYNYNREPHIRTSSFDGFRASSFDGCHGEFSTKERLSQFVALGKLLQLRDYWVKHSEFKDAVGIFTWSEGVIDTNKCNTNDCALTFPTQEMADKFITCFRDLIKQASPLV